MLFRSFLDFSAFDAKIFSPEKIKEDTSNAKKAIAEVSELVKSIQKENLAISQQITLFDLEGAAQMREQLKFQIDAINERIQTEKGMTAEARELLKVQIQLTNELGKKQIDKFEETAAEQVRIALKAFDDINSGI